MLSGLLDLFRQWMNSPVNRTVQQPSHTEQGSMETSTEAPTMNPGTVSELGTTPDDAHEALNSIDGSEDIDATISEQTNGDNASTNTSRSCGPFDERSMSLRGVPKDIKAKNYDVLILGTDKSRDCIRMLERIMSTGIRLYDNQPPMVTCMSLHHMDLYQWRGKFESLQIAMEKTTFIFVYLTAESCTNEEFKNKIWTCLSNSFRDKDKLWCLVPIHTAGISDHKYDVPTGLEACHGINVNRLTDHYKVDKLADLTALSHDDIVQGDDSLLLIIKQLLNDNISKRLNRDKERHNQIQQWYDDHRVGTDPVPQQNVDTNVSELQTPCCEAACRSVEHITREENTQINFHATNVFFVDNTMQSRSNASDEDESISSLESDNGAISEDNYRMESAVAGRSVSGKEDLQETSNHDEQHDYYYPEDALKASKQPPDHTDDATYALNHVLDEKQ